MFFYLFNDALNTFYLRLYGVGHMVEDHMGYSFRLTTRVVFYAQSHRQDSTYHDLCYTSRGALVGTRNSSVGPPSEGSIRRSIAPRANALTTELRLAPTGGLLNLLVISEMNFDIFLWVLMLLKIIFRSNQWSTTGLSKAVICTVLSMEKCI